MNLQAIITIARSMLVAPLLSPGAGMPVNWARPAFAGRAVHPISLVANVLLVVAAAPLPFVLGPAGVSLIGSGALIVFVAFIMAGLTAGHFLGGPDPRDPSVSALFSASRHPGVLSTPALGNFPEQKSTHAAVPPYLAVSAIPSIPCILWRKQRLRRSGRGVET